MYGICYYTLIPMRKEAAERSEMVSQVLFGETFEYLKTEGSWSYIKTHFDHYEGWVSTSMTTVISDIEFEKRQKHQKVYLKDPICKISDGFDYLKGVLEHDRSLPISFLAGGSTLIEEKGLIVIGNHTLKLENNAELFKTNSTRDIIGTALKFINSPYLWGGRTAFGIDCSGFTQVVFKSNGIALPRDAYQQAELGNKVAINETKPCDLAFFHNDSGRIMHVGIVLENNEILHCSGKVHIDKLDETGIFNYKSKSYTHQLSFVKRIV